MTFKLNLIEVTGWGIQGELFTDSDEEVMVRTWDRKNSIEEANFIADAKKKMSDLLERPVCESDFETTRSKNDSFANI